VCSVWSKLVITLPVGDGEGLFAVWDCFVFDAVFWVADQGQGRARRGRAESSHKLNPARRSWGLIRDAVVSWVFWFGLALNWMRLVAVMARVSSGLFCW
jgi:hypothetical protein